MKPATWKVRSWPARPEDMPDGDPLPLDCARCGREALLPTAGQPGALVIATLGMTVVFDPAGHVPPDHWMPSEIECRRCGTIYGGEPASLPEVSADVRQAPRHDV